MTINATAYLTKELAGLIRTSGTYTESPSMAGWRARLAAAWGRPEIPLVHWTAAQNSVTELVYAGAADHVIAAALVKFLAVALNVPSAYHTPGDPA